MNGIPHPFAGDFMMSMAHLAHVQFIRNEEREREKAKKKKEEELEKKVYIPIFLLTVLALSFLPLIAFLYGGKAAMLALAIIIPSTVGLFVIAYFLLISFHHDY